MKTTEDSGCPFQPELAARGPVFAFDVGDQDVHHLGRAAKHFYGNAGDFFHQFFSSVRPCGLPSFQCGTSAWGCSSGKKTIIREADEALGHLRDHRQQVRQRVRTPGRCSAGPAHSQAIVRGRCVTPWSSCTSSLPPRRPRRSRSRWLGRRRGRFARRRERSCSQKGEGHQQLLIADLVSA